jgi:hypothetical protein
MFRTWKPDTSPWAGPERSLSTALGAKALEFQVMTRYAESRSPLDLDRQARGQAHLQVGNASAILAYDMMVVVVLSRFRRASGFARRVMPE